MFKTHREFLDLLQRHDVPFCVIGGYAVQVHGYVRQTEDLDVVWLRTDRTADRMLTALHDAGARRMGPQKDRKAGLEELLPVTALDLQLLHTLVLWIDYGFIDLFDYVLGYHESSIAELISTGMALDGTPYASLDWLRKMKQASGRPDQPALRLTPARRVPPSRRLGPERSAASGLR